MYSTRIDSEIMSARYATKTSVFLEDLTRKLKDVWFMPRCGEVLDLLHTKIRQLNFPEERYWLRHLKKEDDITYHRCVVLRPVVTLYASLFTRAKDIAQPAKRSKNKI